MNRFLAWLVCCALAGWPIRLRRATGCRSARTSCHNGAIPAKYTCDGQDSSPPLSWADVPAGTKSLVLIVDGPGCADPAARA